jgi:hypothetical protein
MGEKKKKEKSTKLVKKVLIVGACVLFVVLMIISGMGTGWLTMFTSVKPGDTVVIDYTFFDVTGNPVLTTDQTLYSQTPASGKGPVLSRQISITSNQTMVGSLYPVQIYIPSSGWSRQYAIFTPEFNAISLGVIGMKTNEHKRITIPFSDSLTQNWSTDVLLNNKVNISEINVGDYLSMGVSDKPEAEVSNVSSISYIRIGEVSQKSPSGVEVDFGYPVVDVKVVSINKRQ